MRRRPLLAVTVTLAVAIGAGATVFSLVDAILLRPLPFPDAGRVWWISERFGRNPMEVGLGPDYYSLRERRQVFREVAAFAGLTVNWSGGDRPEQVDAAQVTPSFFGVLGVAPAIGRIFAEAEQGSSAPSIVVVSHGFWRTRLHADPHALERDLLLDGAPYRVVGVMPRGFDYPQGTQLWRPLRMDESSQRPRSATRPVLVLNMIARIRRDLDEPRVRAELPTLGRSLLAEWPEQMAHSPLMERFTIVAEPLQRRITGDVRPALYALSGAVLLVILIACANLANLLLARAAERRREFAVRLAMGATRAALARQLLLECGRLALPGGALGVVLAALAVRLLNVAQPLALDRYPEIALDWRTLLFATALTLASALVFGMAPVLAASSTALHEALKSGGYGHSASRGVRAARSLLATGELALSLVLLIGAGLLARSFLNLARIDPGFPSRGLVTLKVNLTGPSYRDALSLQRYYRDALAGLAAIPGVSAAAVASDLPLTNGRFYSSTAFRVDGRAPLPPAEHPQSALAIVSAGYARALGLPLRAGRFFETADGDDTPQVAVINEALARKVFPSEDPVGKTIVIGQPGRETRWTIAGVVGSVRSADLGAEPAPLIYRCLCQQGNNRFVSKMSVLVRGTGDPSALARAAAARLGQVDSAQPVFDVKPMDDLVSAALAPARFQLWLIGIFTAIALVLAAVGVYGVMACVVAQRTREIGIRIALGARPAEVERMVLGETARIAACAAAAGLAGAWGLTRYLKSMLYGVAPLDAATFALAAVALAGVALASAFAPARRAAALDPLEALRDE